MIAKIKQGWNEERKHQQENRHPGPYFLLCDYCGELLPIERFRRAGCSWSYFTKCKACRTQESKQMSRLKRGDRGRHKRPDRRYKAIQV